LIQDNLAKEFDKENPEAAQVFKNVRSSSKTHTVMCGLTAFCVVLALQPFFHKELWAIAAPLFFALAVSCTLHYMSWRKMNRHLKEAAEILVAITLKPKDGRYGRMMVVVVARAHGVEFMVR
jgi:predicted histidine transporter YuiF (NhaC family)